MNVEDVRNIALSLSEKVEETFPFRDDTLVFKICGKWFLVVALENPEHIVTKVNPELGEELRAFNYGIEPAWHFNKRHWIQTRL